MSLAFNKPRMTRDEFLAWAEAREGRWEFDGFAPVAMTGGTLNHSRIGRNILAALALRMRGTPGEVLGPDAGLAVGRDGVRYPDASVTCSRGPGTDRLIPGVVIVFEVVSPGSGRVDRIVKLREYQGVPSIRRYVILENTTAAATVLARATAEAGWTATSVTETEMLDLPEIGLSLPLAEFYDGVAFEEIPKG